MDKKINLINKFRTYKFPVEVLYNTEENDKYNFSVKMRSEKGKEYAVLFVNKDESFYTAEILDGDEKAFSVNKLKIAKCEKIRIVDIETEQAVYEADFKISSNSDADLNCDSETNDVNLDSKNGTENDSVDIVFEDKNIEINTEDDSVDIAENDAINIKMNVENDSGDTPAENGDIQPDTDNQAIELQGPVETDMPAESDVQGNANTKSAVKIKSIVAETEADIEISDGTDKAALDEEIDYYADYEKDSAQSCAISEDEHDPYDIDLFMENTVKPPEIKKSQKAALINDNEGVLEELFEKFDLFETPLKNHVFYKLDEANAKKSALKIILNGFIVPVLSPLLEYKNPFGTSGNYPKYLIGETVIDNETEYYVYGTLGRNLREEQPFSGATGFVYFEKIKDSEEGYWLMYVNAKTGRISLPMRPKNI